MSIGGLPIGIASFLSCIQKQQKGRIMKKGLTELVFVVDRKPIAEVANLTDKDYQVRGCINMEGFRRRLHQSGCPQGEARRCGHGQCQGFRAMRFPRVRLQQPFPMD
jgi:hypothetical protein